jgi:DNA polymerase IV
MACGSRRLLRHPERDQLAIAHIDCDSFYASVEKRDRPELADAAVIVGGGQRGVVSACCYVARLHGVRSAMPMFRAMALCPDAVVIRPDMKKYVQVGRQVRQILESVTPLVEPLSIDEAFLDLSGTAALHGGSPALTLIRTIRRIETEVGITASVGLSYNKFLAKLASDLDKPRGFAVIGRAEAVPFLDGKSVGMIWGVGKALQRRLEADGLTRIGQLRDTDEALLIRRYGSIGRRLSQFSHGEDNRAVISNAAARSISAETTFNSDLSDREALEKELWRLCETVARRLKAAKLAGAGVTLKLKTPDFRLRSRSSRLYSPTQLADRLFRAGIDLLIGELDGQSFRLIGIGCHDLVDGALADPPDMLDPGLQRRKQVEQAMDSVRARLGADAVVKGRALGRPVRD